MEYSDRLKKLKEDIEKNKSLKIRAEARLEQLNIQQNELVNEIKSFGINPEELESEIQTLKSEIDKLFEEAESLLPGDLNDNR